MQQRQLRLGDILDDYCPRERRVTNHAVVAMVGADVKQTRCTTCDAEHEYKHAKVPRQRRKSDTPAALYSHPATASGPKRVAHEPAPDESVVDEASGTTDPVADAPSSEWDAAEAAAPGPAAPPDSGPDAEADKEEGPVHRQLIRATLPRPEGQPPPMRPAPEFTIRQPAGRQGRFRPRHQRGPSPFYDNRSGNSARGGGMRPGGSNPQMARSGKRHGSGRKRSK